jgi:hypothetical protein
MGVNQKLWFFRVKVASLGFKNHVVDYLFHSLKKQKALQYKELHHFSYYKSSKKYQTAVNLTEKDHFLISPYLSITSSFFCNLNKKDPKLLMIVK